MLINSKDKAVEVKIFNQKYRLATSQDRNEEYIEKAANYLDNKMQEAAKQAGHRATLDIAILAALNIAEEVLSAREHNEQLINKTSKKLDSFTEKLNQEQSDGEETSPNSRF